MIHVVVKHMSLFTHLNKLRDLLRQNGLDAVAITSWENLYYLTGMRPLLYWTKGVVPMPLLVHADKEKGEIFVSTAAFSMAVKREHRHIKDVRPYEGPELWDVVANALSEWKAVNIGLEYKYLSKLNCGRTSS